MKNVIVPLNAFKRLEVLENGQASFVELIAQAGAFGVEIRRELLQPEDPQLENMKRETEKYNLLTVYSAPIECWVEDHQLNEQHLRTIFQEGAILGAKWIKVSLGHYEKGESNMAELSAFLQQHPGIQLLVENDQTPHGGNVASLQSFFEGAARQNVPVKMTFDAGNWYYSGQDVEDAVNKLEAYVIYLHLKQVEVHETELVTVPLQQEGNHSWKKVMASFPSSIVKALEFPIEPKTKTKDFIEMITDMSKEREALTACNS